MNPRTHETHADRCAALHVQGAFPLPAPLATLPSPQRLGLWPQPDPRPLTWQTSYSMHEAHTGCTARTSAHSHDVMCSAHIGPRIHSHRCGMCAAAPRHVHNVSAHPTHSVGCAHVEAQQHTFRSDPFGCEAR